MKSVADDLRWEQREAVRRLAPEERVRLALELGERDVEAFRAAHALRREEAVEVLRRRRRHGRIRSVAVER